MYVKVKEKILRRSRTEALSIGKYITLSRESQFIKFFVFLKNATQQVILAFLSADRTAFIPRNFAGY
jgi:hypothetical protein